MALNDLILFVSASVYFGTMMFDHHPRAATLLSAVLLISTAGTVMLDTKYDEAFRTVSTVSLAAILLRRCWIEWRH